MSDQRAIEILLKYGAILTNKQIIETVNPQKTNEDNQFKRVTSTIVKQRGKLKIEESVSYHKEKLGKYYWTGE